MKKSLSLLLAILMLVGVMTSAGISAGALTEIDTVSIYGVIEPVSGSSPVFNAMGNDSFSIEEVTWYNDTDSEDMTSYDKFVKDKSYTVSIVVKAQDGYSFMNPAVLIDATINSGKASVFAAYDENTAHYLKFKRTFTAVGSESDYDYTINDADEVTITSYNGSGGDVEIPAYIEDCPVTTIGEQAFYDNDDITSIVIPNTVIEIGVRAFSECSSITSVEIPESVEKICESAFESCDVLESVTVKSYSGYIGEYAFSSCPALKGAVIEEGITAIKPYAFYDCGIMMSADVPETVTEIGAYALGYYYDSEANAKVSHDGFMIYGYDGSEAESYAIANGFMYTSLNPIEVFTDIGTWKYPYTGKAIKPAVKVTDNKGNKLKKDVDYTLKYPKNPVNAGYYSIDVVLKGVYSEVGIAYANYCITTIKNTMTVSASSKTVKYTDVKKKNVTVKAITVKKPVGKVSYKKISGNNKITVNTTTGKVTVKKGLKKGTYTVKVKVTAKGNTNYKSANKTVSFKIKVK